MANLHDDWLNKALAARLTADSGDDPDFSAETVEAAFEAIWPDIRELLAKETEYEHCLGHVADPHDQLLGPLAVAQHPPCPDCRQMAETALTGELREQYREEVDAEWEDFDDDQSIAD